MSPVPPPGGPADPTGTGGLTAAAGPTDPTGTGRLTARGRPAADSVHAPGAATGHAADPVAGSAAGPAAPHPMAAFSAATVSDALDRLGLRGSAHGIGPLSDRAARFCGRAHTVRYVNSGSAPGTVGDYLDDVLPGHVVVLDNGGRTDCTVWGDILTTMAADRGVAGTVIHGVCRDVSRALELGYPIHSRGRFMRTGKDRVEVSDVQRPVTLGDVQVAPGDLVLGDPDGVVVVPAAAEDAVLAAAREIAEREAAIVADVLAGTTLATARARHGYHHLQRDVS